jgi:hypothetical protein
VPWAGSIRGDACRRPLECPHESYGDRRVRRFPRLCGAVHPSETNEKRSIPTVTYVKVSLVRWPTESDRREALRQAGEPRLLLVEQGAPPVPADHREDWIRLPADDVDLRVRVEALRRRLGAESPGTPGLDDDGVLRVGDRWVALPPVEARLAGVLVDRFGAVVSRDTLTRVGWPGGSSSRNPRHVPCLI